MSAILEEDKEILFDFITESNEALEKTEMVLLNLEETIAGSKKIDSAKINTIFRTFHSIKGSAGFIGLSSTQNLTHEAETLLDLVRKDKLDLSKKHIDIFLEVSDTLMMMMNHLQENFTEDKFPADTDLLCSQITGFISEAESGNGKLEKEEQNSVLEEQEDLADEKNKSLEDMTEEEMLDALITPEMEKQFVVDSTDLLDSLEQDLLSLEKDPANMELIENAFRTLHSLKGNAGFFNYMDINQICHKAETFLDMARTGKAVPGSSQISLILQVLDFIKIAVDNLDDGKPPVIMGKIGLIDLMNDSFGFEEHQEDEQEKQEKPKKEVIVSASKNKTKKAEKNSKPKETPEKQTAKSLPDKKEVKPEVGVNKVKQEKTTDKTHASSVSEVIRVDVNKLNTLMDLVGEIVISESMVSHNPDLKGMELESFEKSISYLQKNVRELQELSTSMRMIPLNGVFGKMKRLIRDLSSKNNKKIDLVISGGETEVDRSVLEHISDPLVHILRNAADHGIQTPAERKKIGKSETGKIDLSAKQVGGEIWIMIKDDGAGLNKEKLLSKALEKGIIQESELDMPDEKVWNLIFAPGFSTAAKVSDISGRGVGMDVVLRNVEKIRGKVEVTSHEGEGTTINLRIPLTTAIVDGMIMRVENSIYAIPTLDIKESLQVGENNIVDLIDGQEVIKIRENLIPVLRVHELHNLSFEQKPLCDGIVVVTEKDGKGIGFLVDEILGQQQLVIKALPKYLGSVQGVSGCAILGTGEICLILELANLIKMVESVV
ncbi:MAG: chemotaxis protein CheA [Calditrichaeota bacterium]|nr:chemotaxis protein CheA [Calditrichota bacterium]